MRAAWRLDVYDEKMVADEQSSMPRGHRWRLQRSTPSTRTTYWPPWLRACKGEVRGKAVEAKKAHTISRILAYNLQGGSGRRGTSDVLGYACTTSRSQYHGVVWVGGAWKLGYTCGGSILISISRESRCGLMPFPPPFSLLLSTCLPGSKRTPVVYLRASIANTRENKGKRVSQIIW